MGWAIAERWVDWLSLVEDAVEGLADPALLAGAMLAGPALLAGAMLVVLAGAMLAPPGLLAGAVLDAALAPALPALGAGCWTIGLGWPAAFVVPDSGR
jgi:hypothetical protein